MKKLSQPLQIDKLVAPNRIVMPPLVIWQARKDGKVLDVHLEHYKRSLGAGIVIVEATVVSPEGRIDASQLGIWDDSQIDGLAQIASHIRKSGALAAIQIHHAGGESTLKGNYGLNPVVPSLLPNSNEGAIELTEKEIERIITNFGSAAKRAVKAGYQVIELHGAHGYLGSQFLSQRTNHRTDRWGGSLENRYRFLVEATKSILTGISEAEKELRENGELSDNAPGAITACRLGAADGFEGGVSVEEGIATANAVIAAGCRLLDVSISAGCEPTHLVPEGSSFDSKVHLAGLVRTAVNVPVIGVGSINTPQLAEAALDAGLCDAIAVGRGILADPAWAKKALSGRENEIEVCKQCRTNCFHHSDGSKCPTRRTLSKQGVPVLPARWDC